MFGFFLFSWSMCRLQNAILSALPYLAMWIISLVVCPISDLLINRGYIGVAAGRKIFNSIGHWGPALALIILPYLQKEVVAVTVLTIAVGLDGFTYCGYICNHMDLSPNFAGSLMGLTNSLANILSILGPTTVGLILTDTKDIDVSTRLSDANESDCFANDSNFQYNSLLPLFGFS